MDVKKSSAGIHIMAPKNSVSARPLKVSRLIFAVAVEADKSGILGCALACVS